MDLILIRTQRRDDGIFGELYDVRMNQIAVTLEHAYDAQLGDGSYTSKLKAGTYICQYGMHTLHSSPLPFPTFEITGVAGHTNILFHVGNYNKDSDGCVLLGKYTQDANGHQMIGLSRSTFGRFMGLQEGVDKFILTVKDI